MLGAQLLDSCCVMKEVRGNMPQVFETITERALPHPHHAASQHNDLPNYILDNQSLQVSSISGMSSTNRAQGIGGRGKNKPLPVPPGQDRDRGRRGQPLVQDEAGGRSGLPGESPCQPQPFSYPLADKSSPYPGQRQVGDASGRGTRNLPTRGGSSSATRQGTGNPAPGGSRAAAAAYEATRRQRAADEKARIKAGRQSKFPQARPSSRQGTISVHSNFWILMLIFVVSPRPASSQQSR